MILYRVLQKTTFQILGSTWGYVNLQKQSCFLPLLTKRNIFDYSNEETVFALSSGQGKSGVAVVRVSGPKASEAIRQIGQFKRLPVPRLATLRKLVNYKSGETIDRGLVLWFPGPTSFTGEDSVEFHIHGGSAVVLALLNTLSQLPGFKHAESGDFTKRAFANGKLDLTEVEGLADLIHAETEAQRKQALRQMEGDLSKLYNVWSSELLQSVAHVEATIDFGEEENIEDDVIPKVVQKIQKLLSEIRHHLQDGRRGERLRTGIHVAIIGAPNVGKSSLLNILCQRPAAIVSKYAGTTRDVVESSLDIFGYPVILSDTAGLRLVDDPVEEEGIRRALQRAEQADLKILMADCCTLQDLEKLISSEFCSKSLSEFARVVLNNTHTLSDDWIKRTISGRDTIVVMNKLDLIDTSLKCFKSVQESPVNWISCKTQQGVDSFLDVLKQYLENLGGNPLAGSPTLTQARHRHHLQQCVQCLESFIDGGSDETGLVVAAEELRMALRQLGRITGKVGVEEILDVIFRDFCIGK